MALPLTKKLGEGTLVAFRDRVSLFGGILGVAATADVFQDCVLVWSLVRSFLLASYIISGLTVVVDANRLGPHVGFGDPVYVQFTGLLVGGGGSATAGLRGFGILRPGTYVRLRDLLISRTDVFHARVN